MSELNTKNSNIERNEEQFPVKKQILLFGLGWLGFQVVASIIQIIVFISFSSVNSGITAKEVFSRLDVSMLVNSLSYIFLLAGMLFLSNVDLKKLLPSFKRYQSIIAGIVCFLVIMAFAFAYNFFLDLIKVNISDNVNETGIKDITEVYPVLCVFIFGIIGPICEELTYRVGLFSAIKRKSTVYAYVVTIIVFTLIHFNLDMDNIVNELLNIPFYAFAAFALSYTYDKYGFAGSVTAHLLNNLFSLVLIRFIA